MINEDRWTILVVTSDNDCDGNITSVGEAAECAGEADYFEVFIGKIPVISHPVHTQDVPHELQDLDWHWRSCCIGFAAGSSAECSCLKNEDSNSRNDRKEDGPKDLLFGEIIP